MNYLKIPVVIVYKVYVFQNTLNFLKRPWVRKFIPELLKSTQFRKI